MNPIQITKVLLLKKPNSPDSVFMFPDLPETFPRQKPSFKFDVEEGRGESYLKNMGIEQFEVFGV
jgi:hypothetical protein